MINKAVFVLLAGFTACAFADPFPKHATFTTLATTPFAIEGLTGDAAGNLYTTGRQLDTTKKCPVWRFAPNGTRVTVAFIENSPACNPSGITFDTSGALHIADAARGGVIWRVVPDPVGCASDDSDLCSSVPTAPSMPPFVSGAPGTNGLAFDRDGNLFTGDGTTGEGRVWKIAPGGGVCESSTPPRYVGCVELFRVQPMANVLPGPPTNVTNVANVGRDTRTLPPGTINATRQASNTAGSQPLVANGVAFDHDGDLYIADTARGAIWRAQFDRRGELKSATGCDSTFPPNTLCLDNVFVAHPYLEGTDGIALDGAGNIWNSANERNAIVVVTKQRDVIETFRNPARTDQGSVGMRNSADAALGDNRILEFPTSPFLHDRRFCTSNSDGDRRDNSPRASGQINAGAAATVQNALRGKISCMDQDLTIPGLPLPVR